MSISGCSALLIDMFYYLVVHSLLPFMDHGLIMAKALDHSMKPWAIPCRATQDGWVIVKSFDKTRSIAGGNGNPFQCSCLGNPMDSMKRQKDMSPPRSERVQDATAEDQRAITNSSKKNEAAGPKQKQMLSVDVSGGKSKVWCCKK